MSVVLLTLGCTLAGVIVGYLIGRPTVRPMYLPYVGAEVPNAPVARALAEHDHLPEQP